MPPPINIRALNYLRREYLPSYLGLRLLLDQIPKGNHSAWTADFVSHASASDRALPYRKHRLFKAESEAGIAFRECFASSPTAALAEITALNILERCPQFSVPDYVYSYRWPANADKPYCYDFFLNGYQHKKERLRETLRESRDYVAVIADIKSFYPTAHPQTLLQRLEREIADSSIEKTDAKKVMWCSRNLFSNAGGQGIPIGTAMGHYFGHLALRDLDHAMFRQFGMRYFRYVDDITIVLPKDDMKSAQSMLSESVKSIGFSLNTDKADVVPSDEWDDPQYVEPVESSFRLLRWKVATFLKYQPERYDELHLTFSSEGIPFPLEQFRPVSTHGSWLQSVQLWLEGVLENAVPKSASEIVAYAVKVRRRIRAEWDRASDQKIPPSGTRRKWKLQKMRWLLNRLLYLTPLSGLAAIHRAVPLEHELAPNRAVIQALLSEDATEVLPYAGPAVAAFCQLWRKHRPNRFCKLSSATLINDANFDAFGHLVIWGVISLDAHFSIQTSDEAATNQFLRFCSFNCSTHRERSDLTYLDEIRTLQISSNRTSATDLLSRRYSSQESVFLDALMLGSGASS